MASCKKAYTADFFKKEQKILEPDADDNVIQRSTELGTSCRYLHANIREEIQAESDETSSDEDVELLQFNNEDRIISRLYREVVDDIMARNKLRESKVDYSIVEMKREILQGHKKGFRRFRGINFGKPVNCCGYLRRYAICHTGLVKQIIWNFFLDKNKTFFSELAKAEIITQNHLKVVSLGGGPGSDLVGFCCALQEIESSVKELDLFVVDIGESWEDVFLTILRKAFSGNFGSLSDCMKKTKINAGFKEADLTSKGIFRDKDLLKFINEADLVLMVKVTSFMADADAGDLIHVSFLFYMYCFSH